MASIRGKVAEERERLWKRRAHRQTEHKYSQSTARDRQAVKQWDMTEINLCRRHHSMQMSAKK
jgi:hypothetical protein